MRARPTPRSGVHRITTVRSFFTKLLGACLFLYPTASHSSPSAEHQGVRRVCTKGPGKAVAQAQAQRGDAEVSAAGVLPNPELIFNHERLVTGPENHQTTIGVSVPLGIGGAWFLLNDAAAARRAQARAVASSTLLDAAIQFRRAYVAASLDKARVAVLVEHQARLDALSKTIAKLVEGEERAPYDLLRQKMQSRLHERRLSSMTARAKASHEWLEAWSGQRVLLSASDLLDLAGGKQPLLAAARKRHNTHPLAISLEAAARANAIEADAARRRWIPDLEVFVGYRTATSVGLTGHGFLVGLALPLTFFDHGQGEARRAEARQQLAAAEASNAKRHQNAAVRAEAARLASLEAHDLDEVVRDARTLLANARLLYSADEASIADLLDAYNIFEQAHLARIDAIEEVLKARLDLMLAAATQFDAALDRACGNKPKRGVR